MKDFKFTIVPGTVPAYTITSKQTTSDLRVTVEYRKGKLSICGSYLNGGGQCYDTLLDEDFAPAPGWTRTKAAKLAEVWKRWHLNDMRPACEHQRALGWDKLAEEYITYYRWTTNIITDKAICDLKAEVMETVAKGESFTATEEQAKMLSLKAFIISYEPKLHEAIAGFYEPVSGSGGYQHVNTEYAGHTYCMEYDGVSDVQHPDGLLCKPCPVCGYKYGTAWLHEEVPEGVLEWLRGLKT